MQRCGARQAVFDGPRGASGANGDGGWLGDMQSARRERERGLGGRNERGVTARARARLKGSEARGEHGRVGAGSGVGFHSREGRGWRQLEEKERTGGPSLSAGERWGERGVAGWARPKERRARGRVGPKRPRGETEGKRKKSFFCHFLFQINFPNAFSN